MLSHRSFNFHRARGERKLPLGLISRRKEKPLINATLISQFRFSGNFLSPIFISSIRSRYLGMVSYGNIRLIRKLFIYFGSKRLIIVSTDIFIN